jgi:hypothetical protein
MLQHFYGNASEQYDLHLSLQDFTMVWYFLHHTSVAMQQLFN